MVDTGLKRKMNLSTLFKIFKNKFKLNVKIIKAKKNFFKKFKKYL